MTRDEGHIDRHSGAKRTATEDVTLLDAPDLQLQRPFKITQLSVHLNDDHDQLLVTLRLPSEHLSEVASTAKRSVEAIPDNRKTPVQTPRAGADADGAPDGIRTRTVILLRDLPLPIGLRGRGEPRP